MAKPILEDKQYSTRKNNSSKIVTTSIEDIFRFEITVIKICGGFLFEYPPKFLKIFYQASIILLTKLLATSFYTIELTPVTQVADPITRASFQNVRLFRITYMVVSYITVFVSFFTALKYNKLLLVILKKRLDKRYLGKFEWCQQERQQCDYYLEHPVCHRRSNPMSSSKTLATSVSDGSILAPNETAILEPFDFNGELKMDSVAQNEPLESWKVGYHNQSDESTTIPSPSAKEQIRSAGAYRIRIVRILLFANVFSNAFTSYWQQNFTSSRLFAQPSYQVENKSISSSEPLAIFGASTFALNTNNINDTLTAIRSDLNEPIPTTTTTTATDIMTEAFEAWQPNPIESTGSFFDQLKPTNFFDPSILGDHTGQPIASWYSSQNLTKLASKASVILANFLYELSQAALNINQTFGQLFIVLIIVTTLTDMLSYSRFHDALVDDGQTLTVKMDSSTLICDRCRTIPFASRGLALKQEQRTTLLTTELLVQIRDVLIVIRCTSSLNYLAALIFDLTRIGSIMCQFYIAISTGSFEYVLFLLTQYSLVAFGMVLTSLGYHWIHQEVLNLRRFIDEENLLKSVSPINKAKGRYDNRDDQVISHPERITTCRLADDIGNLWPTDWYTPDFKSLLKNNILVITLVATLQQLVEAGVKSRLISSLPANIQT